jgi:drug/metabolite transporter (DMT)-like permease
MHYWLYLIALISLSQASIIIRWSQTDPLILGIWRLFLAALVLKSWTLLQKSENFKNRVTPEQWRNIILTGIFFFIHLYSYAYAAHHTTIAHLMLLYSINPIFTAIGNLIFFKEKITLRLVAAFLLSFGGIYYLVSNNLAEPNYNLHGDLIAILAAITFTAYALFSKHSRKSLPNSIFTSAFYGVASLCFLIGSLTLSVNPMPPTSNSWIAIFLLAIFPTMLGHGIFTYCMNFIDIQILSLGKLIEPIMSAISAWVIFGEPITIQHIVAFVLISSGITLVLLNERGARPAIN